MSLNDTPSSERVHIGFFGRRNAGKSSVVNAVTGPGALRGFRCEGHHHRPGDESPWSCCPWGRWSSSTHQALTTKAPLGGTAGEARPSRSSTGPTAPCWWWTPPQGKTPADQELVELFQTKEHPLPDRLQQERLGSSSLLWRDRELAVSAQTGEGIEELKERIARLVKTGEDSRRLVGDLLTPGDLVVLVTPIDSVRPQGTVDPAPATDHPGRAGRRLHRHCGEGNRPEGHFAKAGDKAPHGHHRQPGLCPGEQRHAQGHPSHLLLHPDGPVQGLPGGRGAGRGSHRPAARMGTRCSLPRAAPITASARTLAP